jgi:Na+-driven multidrug efflux pump
LLLLLFAGAAIGAFWRKGGNFMEKEFQTQPVWKLMLRLGIPAMFAQMFNILYSVVDRIFVGNIDGIGELALASIGICAPAVTAITAFAVMIGTGGSALMSMNIGKGQRKQAQQIFNNALLMLLVISVIVTAGVLVWKRELLYLLGCSDAMYPYANQYFTIYIAGTIFALCGVGLNSFILAQGFSRQGMISVSLEGL